MLHSTIQADLYHCTITGVEVMTAPKLDLVSLMLIANVPTITDRIFPIFEDLCRNETEAERRRHALFIISNLLVLGFAQEAALFMSSAYPPEHEEKFANGTTCDLFTKVFRSVDFTALYHGAILKTNRIGAYNIASLGALRGNQILGECSIEFDLAIAYAVSGKLKEAYEQLYLIEDEESQNRLRETLRKESIMRGRLDVYISLMQDRAHPNVPFSEEVSQLLGSAVRAGLVSVLLSAQAIWPKHISDEMIDESFRNALASGDIFSAREACRAANRSLNIDECRTLYDNMVARGCYAQAIKLAAAYGFPCKNSTKLTMRKIAVKKGDFKTVDEIAKDTDIPITMAEFTTILKANLETGNIEVLRAATRMLAARHFA